jgi:hypothetical protein
MWSSFKHAVLIAMRLFKPDAEKTLQTTLDAAKSIAVRLATAKNLLAEHRATAKELARDNADDATLDEARGKIRAAQMRVDTLSAALTETDQKILQLEQDLVAVADKKQREAAAFAIEKTAEGFASAAADTVTSLGALALHTEAMARFLPDAADLHSFALRAKAELPGSIEMLLVLARRYTDAVLAGQPAVETSVHCKDNPQQTMISLSTDISGPPLQPMPGSIPTMMAGAEEGTFPRVS